MPNYVDGFVLPVPKPKLDSDRKMARRAGKVWMEYGALVGARRPSVTSALGELSREKLLVRGEARGEWILTDAARARIEAVRTAGDQPFAALA